MSFLESLIEKAPKSPAQTALLAAAVLAVGYGAFSLFSGGAGSDNAAPAITEEEAKKMMRKILEAVKLTAPKMLRAADNIKQQIAAQGQQVEDAQILQHFILPHLETAIREATQGICEEFDFDEDELAEAVEVYTEAGDEELIFIAQQIKVIYQQFGGAVTADEELPATNKNGEAFSMTLDDCILLLEELSEQMSLQCDTFAEQFVNQFGVPSDPLTIQKFQMGLMQVTNT
jgi:hypothetical protein